METTITDISFTAGSATAVVNSGQSLSGYRDGDIIFTLGNNPVFVQSVDGDNITLKENAKFTAGNIEAVIFASNVSLREALNIIQTNNTNWSQHFSPFIEWISTSEAQSTMYDTLGNAITVYSAKGLNQLAQNIAQADTGLADIEQRIDAAEIDLTGLETPIQEAKTARNEAVDAAEATAADRLATSDDAEATAADRLAISDDAEAASQNASAALTYRNQAEQFRDQAQAIVLADGNNPVFATLRTTGGMETDGFVTAGKGSGGVSLTHNDGYGNANVTFNHRGGVPEQNGQSGRITVNTDSAAAGVAAMDFELGSATAGVAAALSRILSLNLTQAIVFGEFITKDRASNTELLKVRNNRITYGGKVIASQHYDYNDTTVDFRGSDHLIIKYFALTGDKDVILGPAKFDGQQAIIGRIYDDNSKITMTCDGARIYMPDNSYGAAHTLTGRGVVELVGNSNGNWVLVRVTG